MKTRRRVKRTVREMPRRLTIRLSKGSSRNMVEDPGQADAFSPRTKHSRQVALSRQYQPGEGSESPAASRLHSEVHITQRLGRRMVTKRATHSRQPENTRSPGMDGRWRWVRQDQSSLWACESGLPFRDWAVRRDLCSATLIRFPGVFLYFPAREHLADKFVLKICHCQKYQEEFNLMPEKSSLTPVVGGGCVCDCWHFTQKATELEYVETE